MLFVGSAQKQSRGDRFFEKGDFINAAKQYEQQLDEEGNSKEVLQNLAIAYFNLYEFKKSYKYLKYLTIGRFYNSDKTYDNSNNFLLYQVLSSLGEHDKAIDYLALYYQNIGKEDFNKSEAIASIENFKLKDDDYTISPASFNSDKADFNAIKVDSMIYFVSDRSDNGLFDKNYKWTHRPFLDMYRTIVDAENQVVEEAKTISDKLNSKLHEGSFCFSADGNSIYISKSNAERGKKKFDSLKNNAVHLYKADKEDGKWQKPVKLPFNDVNYSIEHPALNADGTRLYFSSNMPGGIGGFDIYYVEINEDGTYGNPVNLGDKINTIHREQFPFISKEGNLFFASNGHLGLGLLDIFVSKYENNEFREPINLGAPLNTPYDDFSLAYYNDTEGFFSSNRKNMDDDVYHFQQIGDIFPKEYITSFEIKDFASDSYIPESSIAIYTEDNKVFYETQFDSLAKLDLKLFPGKYNFKGFADNYKTKTIPVLVRETENQNFVLYLNRDTESELNKQVIDSTNNSEFSKTDIVTREGEKTEITVINYSKEPLNEKVKEELLKDSISPPVVQKGEKLFFELPPIYFDYDKWNIRADSKKVLDELALKLEKYESIHIKINAHTDSRGTDGYNQLLSYKRAESTRNYLALVGYVNARRMKFEGFGESQPIIDCETKNCSEEDHQQNRRSEFEIIKY